MSTTSKTRPALSTVTLDVAVLDSPVGPLVVMARDGVVVTSGFGTVEQVLRAPAARPAGCGRARGSRPRTDRRGRRRRTRPAISTALDTVLVEQPGGPFLTEIWRVMRQIPAGDTWSYSELAARAGRPAAIRAAGQGCALNRVAPFVPCHRVLRSDGSLGGYAYGLATKRALLDFEGAGASDVDAQLF